MKESHFGFTQHMLVFIANLARPLDIRGFLETLHRADTVAPIVEPVLWIRARRRREHIKAIAEAARQFQLATEHHVAMLRLEEEISETEEQSNAVSQ